MHPRAQHETDWLARLQRTGIEPGGLGGSDDAREALAIALAEREVLEATPGGSAQLSSTFTAELMSTIEKVALADRAEMHAVLEGELGHDTNQAEHLLVYWASPARLAGVRLLATRLDAPPDVVVAAAELVARLALVPWLDGVIEPDPEGEEPAVSPERLLDLLLASGTVAQHGQGADAVLDLTPAFTHLRSLRQQQALGWKAAERRERLGELLLVDDDESLSEAFRLAGSGRSVGELLALHQLTALTALGLWKAWQSLASFSRPLHSVDEASIDEWMTGQALLLVSSPSSRPAQAFEEILTEALRSLDITVGVINADDERGLCERLDVDRPPMLLLLHNGTEIDRIRWTHTPVELRARIEAFLDGAPTPATEAQ